MTDSTKLRRRNVRHTRAAVPARPPNNGSSHLHFSNSKEAPSELDVDFSPSKIRVKTSADALAGLWHDESIKT
jgi:hypothetical protein